MAETAVAESLTRPAVVILVVLLVLVCVLVVVAAPVDVGICVVASLLI